MHEALEEAKQIEMIEDLFKEIENQYMSTKKSKHIIRYAQIMSELAATIIHDSKAAY